MVGHCDGTSTLISSALDWLRGGQHGAIDHFPLNILLNYVLQTNQLAHSSRIYGRRPPFESNICRFLRTKLVGAASNFRVTLLLFVLIVLRFQLDCLILSSEIALHRFQHMPLILGSLGHNGGWI